MKIKRTLKDVVRSLNFDQNKAIFPITDGVVNVGHFYSSKCEKGWSLLQIMNESGAYRIVLKPMPKSKLAIEVYKISKKSQFSQEMAIIK